MNDQPMPATNLLVRIGANQASDERSKTALATPQTLLLDLVAPMPTSSMHRRSNKYNLDTRWEAPPLLRHSQDIGRNYLQKPAILKGTLSHVTRRDLASEYELLVHFPSERQLTSLQLQQNGTIRFEPRPRKEEDKKQETRSQKGS